MTLARSDGPLQYEIEPPPGDDWESVGQWAYEMLTRLVNLQFQPRPQSIVMARVESVSDAELLKPEEGMVICANANMVGPATPAGLYLYLGGVWKRLQLV